ncbi:hypothetical protein SLEP1_g30253 [Rubroshorea leprosula]|uniref:Retrotransposon gag domain-containing protein n=1 Tax=Rubroshorea leprosula TaxID=152421 RepID=A0AAV5K809_9ROSI|nr:hypothetical protein SLEP1_g30253 [Rubroshorea leprosula]
MPPRKSKDKELQPAQAEHVDDSAVYSKGENDPVVPPFLSPFVERSYGNPVFKEKEADRGGDFAESSNVFRGMTERLQLAFKEKNQAMRRLVESQAEFSKRQEETIRQYMFELRRFFEKGTNVMRETGDESRKTLQAVSEQVVEQVQQPRPEISPLVQHFVIGEGQRQHQLMEAATPIVDHGHQPQHKYILPVRKGNASPHHQPCPRDFFQPQVPPTQPVRRDKAKETMGVDADHFPVVSVDVNVADLRSVARNHSLPYAQRNLATEDLRRWEKVSHPKFPTQNPKILKRRLQHKKAGERKREQKQMEAEGSSSRRPRQPTKRNMVWVRKEKNETVTQTLLKGDDQSLASPKVASVIMSQDGVLKATFEAQEQSGNCGAESKEDDTIHFGEFSVNLSCLVLTLPLVFQAKKEEEPIVCEFLEQTEEETH